MVGSVSLFASLLHRPACVLARALIQRQGSTRAASHRASRRRSWQSERASTRLPAPRVAAGPGPRARRSRAWPTRQTHRGAHEGWVVPAVGLPSSPKGEVRSWYTLSRNGDRQRRKAPPLPAGLSTASPSYQRRTATMSRNAHVAVQVSLVMRSPLAGRLPTFLRAPGALPGAERSATPPARSRRRHRRRHR